MKPIPITEETRAVAARIIWFEAPELALREPIRFMAYAMTYARHEDMQVLRRQVSDDDIREALDKAPPGIIDPRSWAYWNSKMGRYPPPPLPRRKLLTWIIRSTSACASLSLAETLDRRKRSDWMRCARRVGQYAGYCASNRDLPIWRKFGLRHARNGWLNTAVTRRSEHDSKPSFLRRTPRRRRPSST